MPSRFRTIGAIAVLCCVSTVQAQPGKGPGGGGFRPPEMPKAGEILGGFIQDFLKLDADQKKQIGELQKDVDGKLAKILTEEQKKSLENMRSGKGFGFGPPGFGPGGAGGPTPPGGAPGGPPPKMGFGPGGFGGFGAGGNENVQKKIGATDEEWKVISPKLQKVITARRAANGEAGPGTVVALAQTELKTALDDPKHAKADVEEKILAVRKARERARADLADAQRDLIRLLTPAQQAMMVGLGYLE